jgi:hypothetical protein
MIRMLVTFYTITGLIFFSYEVTKYERVGSTVMFEYITHFRSIIYISYLFSPLNLILASVASHLGRYVVGHA